MNNNALDFRRNPPSIDVNDPSNRVLVNQLRINSMFNSSDDGMLTILGPCAMTADTVTMAEESVKIKRFELMNPGIIALHRLPFWKPRTNPLDWHGEITSNPRLALEIIAFKTIFHGDMAAELGSEEHILMFNKLLALGWLGSRNFENRNLAEVSLRTNWLMPLAIKNDMSGDIQTVLERVAHLKCKFPSSTIIPVHRGGTKLDSPIKWSESIKELSARTDGKFILDLAHGSEMAHDPSGNFGKSEQAQIDALGHAKELKQQGHNFKGIMVEMTDAVSPTDPVISWSRGIQLVSEIVNIK